MDNEAAPNNFYGMVKAYEITIIRVAIRHAAGNISEAARILKMNRTTLVAKIEKYGVSKTYQDESK